MVVSIQCDDPLVSSSQQLTYLLSSTKLTLRFCLYSHIQSYTGPRYHFFAHKSHSNNITIFYHWSLSHFHSPQPYTHTSSTPSEFTFRRTKNINIIEFNNDLVSFDLILHPPISLPELLDSYDSTLRSTLDKPAPLITKLSKPRKPNPWYTPALLAVKSARRHLERKYISTHSDSDYKILSTSTNQYHKLIAHAKRQFNAQLIQSSIPNPRLLWKNTNSLLHRKHTTSLPSSPPKPSLAESFASFFSDKVSTLRLKLTSNLSLIPPHFKPLLTPKVLSSFPPA